MISSARIAIMKYVYANMFNCNYNDILLNEIIKDNNIDNNDIVFINKMIDIINNNKTFILNKINELSTHKYIEKKISKIILAILIISIAEIEFVKTHIGIVVSEAINIIKEYADESSIPFINGILGSYDKEK